LLESIDTEIRRIENACEGIARERDSQERKHRAPPLALSAYIADKFMPAAKMVRN